MKLIHRNFRGEIDLEQEIISFNGKWASVKTKTPFGTGISQYNMDYYKNKGYEIQ